VNSLVAVGGSIANNLLSASEARGILNKREDKSKALEYRFVFGEVVAVLLIQVVEVLVLA